ncbi:MAG: DUF4097 family beta strand repeat protein [Candidatus Aminicenantes bacterium]|nr:DUF4097 family beta strand repeat protein [Candidatus Aminicenantes bacterium]
MNKSQRFFVCAAVLILAAALAYTQEKPVDRATVPFSNPSRPGLVKTNVYNGSITVTGYEGSEVVVEARIREIELAGVERESREAVREAVRESMRTRERVQTESSETGEDKRKGLKRIPVASSGLTIEEENNVMSISTSSFKHAVDLTIKVPVRTSLQLKAYNNGDITVENVRGELEVTNHNGAVKLDRISGVVLAHTYNGPVDVTLLELEPNKPMSFSTWNGDIDVTLPASTKASFKMRSDRADIYSDFNVNLSATPKETKEPEKKEGKYQIAFGKFVYGNVNGGGPEFTFQTYNGDIYIRKGK